MPDGRMEEGRNGMAGRTLRFTFVRSLSRRDTRAAPSTWSSRMTRKVKDRCLDGKIGRRKSYLIK
jgi:hypothetical protein